MNQTIQLGLAALVAAHAACNLSSTVGQNEGGGGGDRETTTATTTGATQGPATNATVTDAASTTAIDAASTQQATATTSGGGTIQNVHVELAISTEHGWLGDMTVVEIVARDVAPAPLFAEAPCAVTDVPDGGEFDPTEFVPLDGIDVVATTPFDSRPLIYLPDYRSAQADVGVLPAGTPVTLTFGPTSSLWPGQTITLHTKDAFLSSPAFEPTGPNTTAIFQPLGQDMSVVVTGDATTYQAGAFVTGGSPGNPVSRPVLRCVSAPGASTTIPAQLFTPLIDFRDMLLQQGLGPAETWMAFVWRARQDEGVSLAGNLFTSEARVSVARPLNFE